MMDVKNTFCYVFLPNQIRVSLTFTEPNMEIKNMICYTFMEHLVRSNNGKITKTLMIPSHAETKVPKSTLGILVMTCFSSIHVITNFRKDFS